MRKDVLIQEMVAKEGELGLQAGRVLGVSFWRVVRFKVRIRYLRRRIGFSNYSKGYSKTKGFRYSRFMINVGGSFMQCMKLLLGRRGEIRNVVFAFPRLQRLETEEYMDKFSDPVIEYSRMKESFVIFQKPLSGSHEPRRYHAQYTVKTDALEVLARVFGVLLLPAFLCVWFRPVFSTYWRARICFGLGWRAFVRFAVRLGRFVVLFWFYAALLRRLKAERVFVVNRELHFPAILAAKRQRILVYEFQHGVPREESPLYSGEYDASIDPDVFLCFGEAWRGPRFGMPVDRIVNIGWAYGRKLEAVKPEEEYPENVILVISEPSSSVKILNAVVEIARRNPDCMFHIRLHPQESYDDVQLKVVREAGNIRVVENLTESAVAVRAYKTVLGENSTVLYEALTCGKRVGRLSLGGFELDRVDDCFGDGFGYLKDVVALRRFLRDEPKGTHCSQKIFYSDFRSEVVAKLLDIRGSPSLSAYSCMELSDVLMEE